MTEKKPHELLVDQLEKLVETLRAEERIYRRHAADTSPEGDEHWFYKVEARVWGQAAELLEKVLNKE